MVCGLPSFNVTAMANSSDAKQQGIGERNLAMVDRLLDSHGMYPLVKRLGTSMEEVLKMTARAREEARDTRLKLYLPL